MKAFVSSSMAVTTAVLLAAVAGTVHARSNDGFSSINRQDDGHGNYQYNYDITDWDTNHRRWETVDANNNRRGGYTITDVDGKVRQVEYTADKNGFRAVVKTNEPGTKSHVAGDHDAVYVRDGVSAILRDAQPALQQTGHVIKQKHGHHHHHEHHHEQHHVRPAAVAVHEPLVHTTVVQPPPPPPPPVVVHRPVVRPPVVHETVIQHVPPPPPPPSVVRPVPLVVERFVPKRTVPYAPVISRPAVASRPVFEHVHRVVHQRPLPPPPAAVVRVDTRPPPPIVAVRPQRPVVVVRQPPPAAVVADIPSYSGPRRRPQKFVEDPAQSFETPPEQVILTPKRVPAYAPDQDLPEDFGVIVPTVPPPASRLRPAYTPEKIVAEPVVTVREAPVTRFAPIAIRPVYHQPAYASYGPAYHSTSYQPVARYTSESGGCPRCRGYAKAKSS